MYITTEHAGGVVSRTSQHAIVEEPFVVTIEGTDTELTLEDAKDLVAGLQSAITFVEASKARIEEAGHCLTIRKTKHGMSFVPSKLGKNPTATDQRRLATSFLSK